MAGLQRRARIRDHIARQQRYRLKQFLGKPWRIRPSLSDDEFLRQLQAMDPTLGATARQGVPMRNYPPPDSGAELSIDEIEQILDELATVPDEERLLLLAQRIDRVRASAGDRILA